MYLFQMPLFSTALGLSKSALTPLQHIQIRYCITCTCCRNEGSVQYLWKLKHQRKWNIMKHKNNYLYNFHCVVCKCIYRYKYIVCLISDNTALSDISKYSIFFNYVLLKVYIVWKIECESFRISPNNVTVCTPAITF